jgi:hypothetical protein
MGVPAVHAAVTAAAAATAYMSTGLQAGSVAAVVAASSRPQLSGTAVQQSWPCFSMAPTVLQQWRAAGYGKHVLLCLQDPHIAVGMQIQHSHTLF